MLTTIGSKMMIDLPKQGLFGIPAKVDTGADSSAIWATNIHEKDGTLFFTLFEASSPYYTGEELHATKYRLASIKNSFGQAEARYKVILSVVIAGRRIRVRFTLANRKDNTFPVLIGRRTLKNKFLVDVAHRDTHHDGHNKLLIVSSKITDSVAHFAKEVEKNAHNLSVKHTDYEDFRIIFDDGNMKVELVSTGEDLASYDVVHFKTSVERDITASLARYCMSHGVRVIDVPVRNFPGTSKLYQYAMLANESIRIPTSLFYMPATLKRSYQEIQEQLGTPFVLKGIHVSKGEYNDVIHDKKEFDDFTAKAAAEKIYLIAQAFVPNEGDYRVLVLGKRIALVIYRSRGDKTTTHLNNTSKGGAATLFTAYDLPGEVQAASLRAAAILERDVAGVDMVQDSETGGWYCFEVNDGPQIASGAFTVEKQKAYAQFIERVMEKK